MKNDVPDHMAPAEGKAMSERRKTITVGQPCRIKGGGASKGYIGIVVDWIDDFPKQEIHVRHSVTGVITHYAPHNVEMLPWPGQTAAFGDMYVIAKQVAVDNGLTLEGGTPKPDLMYALYAGTPVFATAAEASKYLVGLNAPIGFVYMPLSQLLTIPSAA